MSNGLFEAECNPAFGEVVRCHFDIDAITGQHADTVFAHFTTGMSKNDVFIVKFYTKHGVGQKFCDHATELDHIFFGQTNLINWCNTRLKWAEFSSRSSFQADRHGLRMGGQPLGFGQSDSSGADLAQCSIGERNISRAFEKIID